MFGLKCLLLQVNLLLLLLLLETKVLRLRHFNLLFFLSTVYLPRLIKSINAMMVVAVELEVQRRKFKEDGEQQGYRAAVRWPVRRRLNISTSSAVTPNLTLASKAE